MRKLIPGVAAYCILGLGSQLVASPLNFSMKRSQVACAQRQLARVQRRMATYGSLIEEFGPDSTLNANGSVLSLWHSTLGGGVFAGIARIVDLGTSACSDFGSGQEHFTEVDLAFDMIFKERTDILDPRHPRIPQVTLARRDGGTNLAVDHAGCYANGVINSDLTCPTILSIDLAAQAQDQLKPQLPIFLNSAAVAAPGFNGVGAQPLAVATGRGLGILQDHLSEACGGGLTDFDQRIFEILARTILPAGPYSNPSRCNGADTMDIDGNTLTIFRGASPHTYRVDVYGYESICCDDQGNNFFGSGGPIALDFAMNWDSVGHLTTGTVTILPACKGAEDVECSNPNASVGLFIVPPIFPGKEEELPAAFKNAPYLNYVTSTGPQNVLSAKINWAEILKNTALN